MNSSAFVTGTGAHAMFVKQSTGVSTCSSRRPAPATITMGKDAKFGPFTPAVVAVRLVVGDKSLNKFRGKAIALHSQVITNFCEFTGAGKKTRQGLIRTAKDNGNVLGFLS